MIVRVYNRRTGVLFQCGLNDVSDIRKHLRILRAPECLASSLREQPEHGTWVSSRDHWEMTVIDNVTARSTQ